jgi:putative addiction module CopG family antidote
MISRFNETRRPCRTSVDIPQDLMPFVQSVISNGRHRNESEVVEEALRIFQELEQRREALRANIVEGMNSGESIPGDEVFNRLERHAADGARLSERSDIEALAVEQGVRPFDPGDAPPDVWPPDESVDEFVEFVREIRKDNSSRSARS